MIKYSACSDLIVIGSRGYASAGCVALGEVGEALLRSAACPALIVPNGVQHRLRSCPEVAGKY